LIFFTYLYAPTVMGLEVAPTRSVVVPTAHDEPAIRLEIFRDVFSRPAALVYNTESEQRLVHQQFAERPLLEDVVGVGVDIPQHQPYPRMPDVAEEEPAEGREPGADGREATGGTRESSVESQPANADDVPPGRDFPSHLLSRGAVFRRRHRLY